MIEVLAFYPNIGEPKVRVTEYTKKETAMAWEYVGALRLTDTPYAVWEDWKTMLECEPYDLSREQMAEMVREYL